MKEIILFGGSNIDYIGTSKNKLQAFDSNIGTINKSHGGVLRNVTENLSRLGNKCIFFTALGNDDNGKDIKNHLKKLGVTVYSPKTNYPSATYLAINDNNNDMALALCDNRVISCLNHDFIKQYEKFIDDHNNIIIDSNLDEAFIDYFFCRFSNKRFFCEAISANKVVRYNKHLKDIYLLKCNLQEAQALTNTSATNEKLISELLDKGIQNVVVSAGDNDIYYGNASSIGKVKVTKITNIVNTTGCGDALFSGIVDYLLENHTLEEAIIFGTKLSALTLNSQGATTDKIDSLFYKH